MTTTTTTPTAAPTSPILQEALDARRSELAELAEYRQGELTRINMAFVKTLRREIDAGQSVADIASHLGLSKQVVHSLLRRYPTS